MVSSTTVLSFLLSLLLLFSSSIAKTPSRPQAVFLPVTKDAATKSYVSVISQRTPLVPVKLTVDLGGHLSWVDCQKGYKSSSFKPVLCGSSACNQSHSVSCDTNCFLSPFPKPGCTDSDCVIDPYNPLTQTSSIGVLATDFISLRSTDGSNPGPFISPSRVALGCSRTVMLGAFPKGVTGVAGLANGFSGLPSQIASAFHLSRKFAICLSSSTTSKGVIFFGTSPYVFLPRNIDFSRRLVYTPLLTNPFSTAETYREEYFIGVTSIKINGNVVPINTTLLTIRKNGNGGTKISTVDPYTTLHTSIYNAFTKAFVKSLAKVPMVKPVAPFKVCYNRTSFGSTRVGPGVPPIELVLGRNKNATSNWTIFGANSMVAVNNEVLCLGFVDGGVESKTSIVVGAHQIEDNILQFDIAKKRLGFSSSLLFSQTTCANFNFTSKA